MKDRALNVLTKPSLLRWDLKIPHEVALTFRLGALRERRPLLGDEVQRCRAVLHRVRVDEPATDNETRAPNPAGAAHGGDAASPLVVLQHVQDLPGVVVGRGGRLSGMRKEWYSTRCFCSS